MRVAGTSTLHGVDTVIENSSSADGLRQGCSVQYEQTAR
jgi:hypothetical protein